MKILSVTLLLIPVTIGMKLNIGAVFDSDADTLDQIFRYATQVANDEILADYDIKIDPHPVQVVYGNEFAATNRLCGLLTNGVSAIFGPTAPSTSTHCMNICDAKDIPYIDVKWDSNTRLPVINMHPHPDALAHVFIDLIKASGWKGFTIVYESAPWLKRAAELLKLYDSKEYTVTVRRMKVALDKTNYRPVLRRVKLSGDFNIVIDCSIEVLPEVLRQAQQVGLMTDFHQFLITSMDLHNVDLEPYRYGGTNITGIRLVDPGNPLLENWRKILVEPNGDYEESEETEKDESEVESENLVTPSIKSALIFDGVLLLAETFKQFEMEQLEAKQLTCNSNEVWESGNSISNFMRNTVVQGLTGEVRFDNRGFRTNFAVDVLQLTPSGIIKVATWNSTNGLNVTRKAEHGNDIVTNSLKNKKLTIITALSAPYGMLKDSALKLSGNDRFEGYGIDLIYELSQLLEFSYDFELQLDGDYGKSINGSENWTGMIGKILNGTVDLAVTDLTITAERESAVDFTMPFMNLGISILFRKPVKEPPSTFSFMSPFSAEVWMYLGGAYLSVSLCFFILGRLSPAEWDNPYPCIEEPTHLENQFSFSNSLWFSAGALLQQGSEIAPKAASTRAVASIWWFFTLIMVASYTANLAAFLIIEIPLVTLKNVENLKNCHLPDGECPAKFGAKRGGSTFNFFKETEHETYQNMYKYMQDNPDLMTDSNAQGLEMVKSDEYAYAYLTESSSLEYLIERDCEVAQVGGLLDDKGYGIAMKKHSPYRDALSGAVLQLQEDGKLTKMKNKWWKEKKGGGACLGEGGGGDAEELKMASMRGVFYVLIVGSMVATFYGIFEWVLMIILRAKRDNVPVRQELMNEVKFIVRCGGNTRTIRHRKSVSSDSRQSNHSNRSYASGN